MEQTMIAALLEKYWQAETTVEEEKQLAEYFRQPVLPAHWEPLRNVFAYFEEEAKITPGEDFETRLLERIRQVETEESTFRSPLDSASPSETTLASQSKAGLVCRPNRDHASTYPHFTNPAPVRTLFHRAPWWAAAAVIILALGLSRLIEPSAAGSSERGSLAQSGDSTPARQNPAMAYNDVTAIKDTYDDPQQALAAIRRALGTASAKMNHGKSITQKQMDRMSGGWQSVLTN